MSNRTGEAAATAPSSADIGSNDVFRGVKVAAVGDVDHGEDEDDANFGESWALLS